MVYGEVKEANVMLVYTKRKSVLPGYFTTNQKAVQFTNIPVDEMALLVVFKPANDKEKVTMCVKPINPQDKKPIYVQTTLASKKELHDKLQGLISDM